MKDHLRSRTTITIILDETERFRATDAKGFPFDVQQIYVSVDDRERVEDTIISLRGRAIKVDGTRGLTDRYTGARLKDIPEKFQEYLKSNVNRSRQVHGSVRG